MPNILSDSIPAVNALAKKIATLFHGYDHGQEMPSSAQPFLYSLGFILGGDLIALRVSSTLQP